MNLIVSDFKRVTKKRLVPIIKVTWIYRHISLLNFGRKGKHFQNYVAKTSGKLDASLVSETVNIKESTKLKDSLHITINYLPNKK